MRARTGTAQLPLHGGKAPAWLFTRMVKLAREIIYGTPASTRDPARFSFAHGGKDGFPYPVDTGTYDKTVEVLRAAVTKAGTERSERVAALKRLVKFGEERVRERLKEQA